MSSQRPSAEDAGNQKDYPAPELEPSPDAFNPAALDMLRRLGDGTLLTKMIDLFLETAADRLAAAQQALDKGDTRGVAAATHSLKSSAGQLGGMALYRAASETERDADAGNQSALEGDVAAIERELKTFAQWLDRAKAEEAASLPSPPDGPASPPPDST